MTSADRLDVLIVENDILPAEELAFLVREAGLWGIGRVLWGGDHAGAG
jgi:hypothetical protein